MSVNYSVLKGQVTSAAPFKKAGDHYQIEVQADQPYRIAIDVYSQLAGARLNYSPDGKTTLDTDRMVMYYKDENFSHPITADLAQLTTGLTPKSKLPALLCLDYLRTQPALFPIGQMQVVPPATGNSAGDNLNNDINPWVQKVMNNNDAEIYALGSSWNDSVANSHPDTQQYFASNPSVGVHDIHMNQGDTGQEAHNNGTYQDGALLFRFIESNQWVAMFFRFQNQSIHTDNNGNPVSE